MTRPLARLLATVACVAVLPSCTALTVDSLPAPGGDRAGYDVTLQFDDVLNLPGQARVVMDGVTVGVVTGVGIAEDKVDVTTRIDSGVVVPSDIHAALKQPTVLGDIFVALERPAGSMSAAPPLQPGDTVPLQRTSSPAQIEDTIAALANFVASGTIQRVQNTMIGVNKVAAAGDLDLDTVMGRLTTNLSELADNLESADLALAGMADTANVLGTKSPAMAYWFSPAGMLGFDRATQVASRLSVMIPSIGSVYSGGFWLVPLLTTMGDATGAVQASKWAVEDELPRWRRLFTDYFLPQDKYPAINITSIVGPDGRELSGDIQDVLRILGAVP